MPRSVPVLLAMLWRFGLIGGLAAVVHIGIVVIAVERFAIDPRLANLFGFMGAIPLSYLGHYHFSFASSHAHRGTVWRFVVVSLICFLTGQGLMHLSHAWSITYEIALLAIVILVPIVSFILNKSVVFQRKVDKAAYVDV